MTTSISRSKNHVGLLYCPPKQESRMCSVRSKSEFQPVAESSIALALIGQCGSPCVPGSQPAQVSDGDSQRVHLSVV